MTTTIAEAVLSRLPNDVEIDWRIKRVSKIDDRGDEFAAEVAASTIDLHDVERLLEQGCPIDVAWQIVWPLCRQDADGNVTWCEPPARPKPAARKRVKKS